LGSGALDGFPTSNTKRGKLAQFSGTSFPCYIACFGYVLIAAGVVLSMLVSGSTGSYLFWAGTAIAGGLAALATVLELIKGDVCPVGPYGIPMCYISLAFSIVIAVLYMLQSSPTAASVTLDG